MGLSLRGSTSGAIDINPPAIAGDNAITLPASNGSANQFFKNSGTAGIVTFSSMVENSGNIGIGTDSPSDILEIQHNLNGQGIKISTIGNLFAGITADANRSAADNHLLAIEGHWNGTPVAEIAFRTGDDTTNKDNGEILFRTSSANNLNASERLRIKSDGQISLRNDASEYGFLKENGLGNVELGGSTELYLSTNGSERLRISPVGAFGLGGVNYGNSGQVLTSNGSGSAVGWTTVTSALSFYFYGRQDTAHNVPTSQYTRVKNFGTNAINQGDSSIATWDESNGTLTIGASGGGYWFLNFGAGIDDISGGYVQVVIGKNGANDTQGTEISTYKRNVNDFNNYIVDCEVTTMVQLEAGDVVSGYVYWISGADASPQNTEQNRCHFLGYKMMT